LLDDELPGLTYLRVLCEQIPNVEVVKAFNDSEKFIASLATLDYNLCILDIEMPKLSGMEVAKLIKDTPVIFTTAYKEYAAEAFDLNAIDYIQKPIQKERFEKAISKATRAIGSSLKKQYAQFNTDKGKAVLLFDEIMYITSSDTDKRDKVVYLEDEQRVTLKNISYEQLLLLLPASKFCRINKKDVIALKAVQFYSHEEISTKLFTKNKEVIKLPLNDTYRAEFKSKL
jgi:two-component system LytT family response regulator